MLAAALSKRGIAVLRYDKRGIGKSQKAGVKEEKLRFEHYISDAKDWAQSLNNDKRFNELLCIPRVFSGHSQGFQETVSGQQASGTGLPFRCATWQPVTSAVGPKKPT